MMMRLATLVCLVLLIAQGYAGKKKEETTVDGKVTAPVQTSDPTTRDAASNPNIDNPHDQEKTSETEASETDTLDDPKKKTMLDSKSKKEDRGDKTDTGVDNNGANGKEMKRFIDGRPKNQKEGNTDEKTDETNEKDGDQNVDGPDGNTETGQNTEGDEKENMDTESLDGPDSTDAEGDETEEGKRIAGSHARQLSGQSSPSHQMSGSVQGLRRPQAGAAPNAHRPVIITDQLVTNRGNSKKTPTAQHPKQVKDNRHLGTGGKNLVDNTPQSLDSEERLTRKHQKQVKSNDNSGTSDHKSEDNKSDSKDSEERKHPKQVKGKQNSWTSDDNSLDKTPASLNSPRKDSKKTGRGFGLKARKLSKN